MKHKYLPPKPRRKLSFWKIVFGVFAFLLSLAFIGELIEEFDNNRRKKKLPERNKPPQIDEPISIDQEIDNRNNAISKLNIKIDELIPQKKQLERNQRRILLWTRITIGIILILSNLWYLDMNINYRETLGDQLNFNGAILLIYSFLAYIFYGSIPNFVDKIKKSAINILLKKKINIVSELDIYIKEKSKLLNEINELEKQKSSFKESKK